MAEKTFRARLVLVGPGLADEALGKMLVMIRDITAPPNNQPTGQLYATFHHKQQGGSVTKIIDYKGQEVSGPVASIPEWEETQTPTVWVARSEGA
jgi:hypothetical protein